MRVHCLPRSGLRDEPRGMSPETAWWIGGKISAAAKRGKIIGVARHYSHEVRRCLEGGNTGVNRVGCVRVGGESGVIGVHKVVSGAGVVRIRRRPAQIPNVLAIVAGNTMLVDVGRFL